MVLPENLILLTFPIPLVTLLVTLFELRKNDQEIAQKKRELDKKIYETLVLREIGQRIDYQLKIDKILDIIIGSLSTLMPFSAVGYILTRPGATSAQFRLHLEEGVNKQFVADLRTQLLESFTKVTGRTFSQSEIIETVDGAIIDDSDKAKIASLWITPLSINEHGLGVLAVADKKSNLYRDSEMQSLAEILHEASRAVNNLEHMLAAEEEKLNAMVASLADGILMLDSQLNLIMANPAVVALLGLPAGTKPTTLDVVQSLADKIDLRAKVAESQKSGSVVVVPELIVGSKASQLFISPVKDSKQDNIGAVVLFHDITASKQLNRIRDEFTAMMVHELRAPLTVVRGATDMFLKNPTLPAQSQGQEILKSMQNSTETMLSLVNDLLDVSKIEAGKFQILETPGNLVDVIHDRLVFFTQLAQPRGISLCGELPDGSQSSEFDRERISQVLNNLLSNALKFTSAGGKVTVSVKTITSILDMHWRFNPPTNLPTNFPPDFFPAVLVSVSDTGMGIAAEKLPELFSKFKQFHRLDHQQVGLEGTGLGLVITKGIIESHGGYIFVESKVNEGTTVHFLLPHNPPKETS